MVVICEYFSFSISFFLDGPYFPRFFFGGGGLFFVPCTSMLSSICCIAVPQAEHSTAHAISPHKSVSKYVPIRVRQRKQADKEHLLYCSIATTAQHSAIIPREAAKQARADQSATTQTSRQSWREPAHHVVEHLYSMAEFSK